uniref:Uncharacterized protein n=1 Tax=Arundo donax TaxID=35708 RepID=A0A0A9GGY6_ARUDO
MPPVHHRLSSTTRLWLHQHHLTWLHPLWHSRLRHHRHHNLPCRAPRSSGPSCARTSSHGHSCGFCYCEAD